MPCLVWTRTTYDAYDVASELSWRGMLDGAGNAASKGTIVCTEGNFGLSMNEMVTFCASKLELRPAIALEFSWRLEN